MDAQRRQILEKLKSTNNILVTVRNNPTIDELAASLALTILLNKMDKRATAIFSGKVPSSMEFLNPEETIRNTTDSLRDFIISLDKEKADKLRYKIEDDVVKIFITPYHSTLSADDLEFSQGDFNVETVVALGVHQQDEIDLAIASHGSILHDATVISINNSQEKSDVGAINWQDVKASSLSEMVTQLLKDLNAKMIDEQIATALLTGVISETERFSNDKTTATTMNLSADLLKAGANQSLVSNELERFSEEPEPEKEQDAQDIPEDNTELPPPLEQPPKPDDGTLAIQHEKFESPKMVQPPAESTPPPQPPQPPVQSPPVADEPLPTVPESPPPTDEYFSQLPAAPAVDVGQSPQDNVPPPDELIHPTGPPEDTEFPGLFDRDVQEHDPPHISKVHLSNNSQGYSAEGENNSYLATDSGKGQNIAASAQSLDDEDNPLGMTGPAEEIPILKRGVTGSSSDVGDSDRDKPTQSQSDEVELPTVNEVQQDLPSMEADQPTTYESYRVPDTEKPNKATLADMEKTLHSPHLNPNRPMNTSGKRTLEDIEASVNSPHLESQDQGYFRDEVLQALNQEPEPQQNGNVSGSPGAPSGPPKMDIHVDEEGNLHVPEDNPMQYELAPNPESPGSQPVDMPMPQSVNQPSYGVSSPPPPPPNPPPMMPTSFMSP